MAITEPDQYDLAVTRIGALETRQALRPRLATGLLLEHDLAVHAKARLEQIDQRTIATAERFKVIGHPGDNPEIGCCLQNDRSHFRRRLIERDHQLHHPIGTVIEAHLIHCAIPFSLGQQGRHTGRHQNPGQQDHEHPVGNRSQEISQCRLSIDTVADRT